jgi:protein phosphatase
VITEEEAANHPRKNVITRVMQPHLKKRSEAEIHITQDVWAGDRFFLCSDGVWGSFVDEQLCEIAAENTDNKAMIKAIYALCKERSRDNFSAYLVPVIEGILHPEHPDERIIK